VWPERYELPEDVAEIETIPLAARNLPGSTYDVLVRAAARWPDRPAISVMPAAARWREHSTVTFGQLLDQVNRVANLLHGVGVRRPSAVGLFSPNCEELVVATLAAETAGVAAPVNPALDPEHTRQLLERSGARVLVTAGPELHPGVWATAVELATDGWVDTLLVLRPTGADASAPPLPVIANVATGYLADLMAPQTGDRFVGDLPTSSDIAAVFHTGGTTGVPKLAAHTHAIEVADAWMIAANTMLDQDSVIFAALPLFHVNALEVTLIAPLLRGQQVVWAGPAGYRDPHLFGDFWRIVEHFGISTMSAVPTIYQALTQVPVDADLSSMRLAMVGASALPLAVREAFEAHTGIVLLEGYGLTEATCASIRGYLGHPRPGAVGQRMPYQQVKVVHVAEDGSWTDLPAGHVGTLVIGGATVFPGYVAGRDETGLRLDDLGKLRDGWLDTGDLARIDEDGFVFLVGRAKDLIIRGGHNIDPATVEDALLGHDAVTAAAAVGRPDVHSGEVPVAFVTLTPGSVTTESELLAWAAAHVAEPAAAPKAVSIVESLPLTAVGKPYKLPLRAEASRAALGPAVRDVPGVARLDAEVEDGTIVAVVHLEPAVDPGTVDADLEAVLGQYAVAWRVDITSGAADDSLPAR